MAVTVDFETGKQVLTAASGVRVWCPGRPRTKGSLKPVHIRKGRGQCLAALREDGEYSVPWKKRMIVAIRAACECSRYEGPVEVHAFFRFEPEMTEAKRVGEPGEGAGKPWPMGAQYGDEDKLRRNLLDALTQSALIKDDRYVVGGQNWKRWVREGGSPGVEFVVVPARPVEVVLREHEALSWVTP